MKKQQSVPVDSISIACLEIAYYTDSLRFLPSRVDQYTHGTTFR